MAIYGSSFFNLWLHNSKLSHESRELLLFWPSLTFIQKPTTSLTSTFVQLSAGQHTVFVLLSHVRLTLNKKLSI